MLHVIQQNKKDHIKPGHRKGIWLCELGIVISGFTEVRNLRKLAVFEARD